MANEHEMSPQDLHAFDIEMLFSTAFLGYEDIDRTRQDQVKGTDWAAKLVVYAQAINQQLKQEGVS